MSRREQALVALFAALRSGVAHADLKRNSAVPDKIGPGGLIILRDGDAGEPEVTLSPPNYAYEHVASIDVLVDKSPGPEASLHLDNLLGEIGTALAANRTLGGAVDHVEPAAPEIDGIFSEAGASFAAARVPVTLIYTTPSPLG